MCLRAMMFDQQQHNNIEEKPSVNPVSDRYSLMEKIGEGGMGTVYKARQVATGRIVAIKFLSEQSVADKTIRARFEHEMEAASSFNHPNLVQILDFSYEDGRPYIVLEYIPGVGLDYMLRQQHRLKLPQIISIFSQICKALSHVHNKGVIHRDLKPSNIMVVTDELGELQVKVVDFGIAKASMRSQSITQTGEVLGSPLYMSPEQALGQQVDFRSDIYSLGCMLYECATGRPPFIGENPIQTLCMRVTKDPMPFEMVAPDAIYPDNLERIVQRAMKREIQDRYPTMAALHADLQELGRVQPAPNMTNQSLRTLRSQSHVAIPEPAPVETKVRWKEFAALVAFIVLFASVVGVFGWMSMKKQPKSAAPAPHMVAPAPNAQHKPSSTPEKTRKATPAASKKSAAQEVAKTTAAKALKPKIIPLPEDVQEDIARAKADKLKKAASPTQTQAHPPQAQQAQFAPQTAPSPFPRLGYAPKPTNLNASQSLTWDAARTLVGNAFEYRRHNNFRKAIECMEQASELFQSVGDSTNAASARMKKADFIQARELSKMNRLNRPFQP